MVLHGLQALHFSSCRSPARRRGASSASLPPARPLGSTIWSVDARAALGLLRVDFLRTYRDLERVSAAEMLDRLRLPAQARHLALEVFACGFFSADPQEFAGCEWSDFTDNPPQVRRTVAVGFGRAWKSRFITGLADLGLQGWMRLSRLRR